MKNLMTMAVVIAMGAYACTANAVQIVNWGNGDAMTTSPVTFNNDLGFSGVPETLDSSYGNPDAGNNGYYAGSNLPPGAPVLCYCCCVTH